LVKIDSLNSKDFIAGYQWRGEGAGDWWWGEGVGDGE